MKLVEIDHARCNEWDCVEYLIAPDSMTAAEIQDAVDATVSEQIADAVFVKEAPERPSFSPEYSKHPDKTVRQINEHHAGLKAEWAKWMVENKKLTRSFQARMCEKGFSTLWGDNDCKVEAHADWGHSHELNLVYGNKKEDV